MEYVKFTVPGCPQGKGRPKFVKIGNFTKAYTPKETVQYENLIKLCYQEAAGMQRFDDEAMIDARIMAYYSIPKSVSKKKHELMVGKVIRPTKKPDADNICKSVLDALNGIAYHDDAAVVDVQIRKFYSENPRVEVILRAIGKEICGNGRTDGEPVGVQASKSD